MHVCLGANDVHQCLTRREVNHDEACEPFGAQAAMPPKKRTTATTREEEPWYKDAAARVREKRITAAERLEQLPPADAPGAEAASSSLTTPAERRAEVKDHILAGYEPQRHTVYVLGRPVQAPRAHPCS